jgi:predicted hotdog family 3-hydroxylacyl-ACP dehydratase
MNLPDIQALVPHGGAMSLLDTLLAVDAETLAARVTIGPETMFCTGVEVGAWVGVEYMAQAVAAHAGHAARLRGEPVRVGFLLGTRRYTCTVPAFAVGSVLDIHVRQALQGDNGLAAFDCRIDDGGDSGDGAVLASATITVFQPANVDAFLRGSFHE